MRNNYGNKNNDNNDNNKIIIIMGEIADRTIFGS